MATSTEPTAAPKNNKATAIVSTLDAVAKPSRLTHIIKAEAAITLRQPMRPASIPVTGMETREPNPRHSSSAPSVASLTASRSLAKGTSGARSEEHTSELQSRPHLVCRLLLEKKKHTTIPLSTNVAAYPALDGSNHWPCHSRLFIPLPPTCERISGSTTQQHQPAASSTSY